MTNVISSESILFLSNLHTAPISVPWHTPTLKLIAVTFNLISPTQSRTTKFFSCSLCSAVLLVISLFRANQITEFFGDSISSHCQESLGHPLWTLDRQPSENSHRPDFRIIDHWFFSGAKEQKLKSSKFLNPIGPLSLPLL